MAITADYVRQVFKGLEDGDGVEFFKNVSDDVDWTVEGTHPLAGHYRSKANFVAGTFAKLGKVLPKGAQLHVEHLLVKDDQAVVELHSLATAKNGMRFDNRYCWITRFAGDKIVEVRAYLDSDMVKRVFPERDRTGVAVDAVAVLSRREQFLAIAEDPEKFKAFVNAKA